jgi:hypothetical protein
MKKIILSFAIALGFFTLCFAQEEAEMQVKRSGFLKKKIAFGNFETIKVKQGWESERSSYRYLLLVKAKENKQKFGFEMTDGQGNATKATCLNTTQVEELSFENPFTVTFGKGEDIFIGEIDAKWEGTEKTEFWSFVITNLNTFQQFGHEVRGQIINDNRDKRIEIKAVIGKISKLVPVDVIKGYEFFQDGLLVGKTDVVFKEKVWIDANLPAQLRLLIANVSTSLFLLTDTQS